MSVQLLVPYSIPCVHKCLCCRPLVSLPLLYLHQLQETQHDHFSNKLSVLDV